MRNTFADTIYELARSDPRICVIVADISPAGSMAKFQEEFPERFVNVGVAEASMIGIAAGLAMRGMRPFAYTIATFALYRPFEFVRDDLAYQDVAVTVVGIGGGVTYSTLGGTHHAQEDVAIATAVPNLRVIAPCDPAEVRDATRFLAADADGPTYLRLAKAGEPTLTDGATSPFTPGKIRYLQEGADVCILSYGSIMAMAREVGRELEAAGSSVSLVSVHTLKPLDRAGIVDALARHARVIVIEEHSSQGSLGLQVRALAWESGATCSLHTFSLRDEFIHVYGSHADLLRAHGLAPDLILAELKGE